MSTLSDLRSTLDERAEQVHDGETVARTAAVHHRVSVVRRRRRAVGAGAVSLVVLAGVAVGVVPRITSDALPAAPTVLGVKAPTTQEALGYTYRTDGSSETVDGSASIGIGKSSQPELVSWTTDQPTTVRLTLPDGTHWTSTRSRFRDSVVIPPGPGGTLRVSVDAGRVGLATYDLTSAQPAGVARDGITFRSTVADAPLLVGAIGAKGQADVRTSYLGVSGQVKIGVLCTGAPSEATVHVVMGRSENDTGCDSTTFDPGANSIGSNEPRRVGERVRVHVWVTRSDGTTPLSADEASGIRLGVGLYGPVSSDGSGTLAIDTTLEYGGHTWRESEGSMMRSSRVYTAIGGTTPSLALIAMRLGGSATPTQLHVRATGVPPEQSGFSGEGGGIAGPYWIPANASVRVTRSTPGVLKVGIYSRVD